MTQPPDNVIVIGKSILSSEEYDALHLLGYALAQEGRQLHTTPTTGAPQAVAEGYTAGGGEPHMHSRKLAQVEGATICVLDNDFTTKLNKARPGWTEDDWTILENTDDVLLFSSILAGWLEATDRSLVRTDGDG